MEGLCCLLISYDASSLLMPIFSWSLCLLFLHQVLTSRVTWYCLNWWWPHADWQHRTGVVKVASSLHRVPLYMIAMIMVFAMRLFMQNDNTHFFSYYKISSSPLNFFILLFLEIKKKLFPYSNNCFSCWTITVSS